MSSYNNVRWHGGAVVTSEAVGQVQLEEDPEATNDRGTRFPMVWGKAAKVAAPSQIHINGAKRAAAHLRAMTDERAKRGEHVMIRGQFGATSHSRTIEPFSFSHAVKTPSGQLISVVSATQQTQTVASPTTNPAATRTMPGGELDEAHTANAQLPPPQVMLHAQTQPRTFDLPRTPADAKKLLRGASLESASFASPRTGQTRRQVVRDTLAKRPEVRSLAEVSPATTVRGGCLRASSRPAISQSRRTPAPLSLRNNSADLSQHRSDVTTAASGTPIAASGNSPLSLNSLSNTLIRRRSPTGSASPAAATSRSNTFTRINASSASRGRPEVAPQGQVRNAQTADIATVGATIGNTEVSPFTASTALRTRRVEQEVPGGSRPSVRTETHLLRTPRAKLRVPAESPKLRSGTDSMSTAARSDVGMRRPQAATIADVAVSSRSHRLRAIAQQALSGNSNVRIRSLGSPTAHPHSKAREAHAGEVTSLHPIPAVGPLVRHRVTKMSPASVQEDEPLEDDWDITTPSVATRLQRL